MKFNILIKCNIRKLQTVGSNGHLSPIILIRISFLRFGTILGLFTLDLPMKLRIHVILKEFERLTSVNGKSCIRFVERTTQSDYVFLSPAKDACFSKLGRVGGRQVTMLGWPCFMANGKIMHEMMHVLGFLHEQSRPDRDNNVKIAWDNIIKGHDKNFLKYTSAQTNLGGMAYDYGSVMHYSQYAFSKNKQRTIIPLNEAGVRIGQRETLSQVDIAKIRMLYGCGTDTEGVHPIALNGNLKISPSVGSFWAVTPQIVRLFFWYSWINLKINKTLLDKVHSPCLEVLSPRLSNQTSLPFEAPISFHPGWG